MFSDKRKRTIATISIVVLNMVLVFCVIFSVLDSFQEAEKSSFTQNVENVRTLTNASANKVSLELSHHMQDITTVSNYVNYYNGIGMTQEELKAYFMDCYGEQGHYSWQLIDNTLNGKNSYNKGFDAISLCDASNSRFSYNAKAYPELSKIFCRAGEDTLGVINHTSEFTDSSPALAKSFGVTTTVRIRDMDSDDGEEGYYYKTLMLLSDSNRINQLISNNNNIDNLDFYDYSNIIVDDNGNYVISNSYFQGTNFMDYITLYNDDFTDEDAAAIEAKLKQEDYYETLYYQNNKEQNCVYTIVPVHESDWHILSIVPIDSFQNKNDYSSGYFRFFLLFSILFMADMTCALILNKQLRRKKKEAEAASIAKTQFLSSMSHDIRTPMNAIIGMTVIADESLKEDHLDKETLRDCIKTIELSGNHLLTLINDILDISKIESGKVALSADDFSISETMSKMLEIVQPQIKEKSFKFETHIIHVEHEFVHADELRINQVFINILSNAIKYTNPGGRITVDLCEEKIPGRTDAARFTYKVSDTGIGMDEEFQKTIFERFTRAVDTRINVVQGSGLGMAIVKQLVDLMGGSITVESKINVGSVFTVTVDLPVADIRADNVNLDNMSALLIDDDMILLETAEIEMKKAGMTVETATAGKTGIDMAVARQNQNNPYDVILVDWRMSGMNGLEVIKELRSRLNTSVKIVVMTAYNIADIEYDARRAGANYLLTKPLFRTKLLHGIQSLFVDKQEDTEASGQPEFDLKVLIAEDNKINWKVLEKLLSRYGIWTEHAENGKEAVDRLENGNTKYDLILMDIQMPVMNGYEATEAIRKLKDEIRASIPIYAMTADTFAEDIAKCMEKGMNGHLSKPVEIDKLLKLLTQINNEKMTAN